MRREAAGDTAGAGAPSAAGVSTRIRRVGLVSPAWPPGLLPNGIVTYVANIRAGLAAVGVSSAIVANELQAGLDARDEDDVADLTHFRPSLRERLEWKARERVGGESTLARRYGAAVGAALRALHDRGRLDLFEMEESFGAARFAQDAIPVPLIVRLHGPWCLVSPALGLPDDVAFRARVASEGRAITAANGISSPSRFALEEVRRHYGVALPDAAVIPNPIVIQPSARQWSYDGSDQRTVLFVGRFDRLKGGDVVLQAFARLTAEFPQARLVFAGPDAGLRDEAGKTWRFDEYVRAFVPAEVAGRIEMLHEQPATRIADLRRASFVTLVASRFETFSMTAVEALSYGSPLVVPAAAALTEIVENGRNGLTFEHGSAGDAARQLARLFRDPQLARRLGAEGATDAARRFAPDVVARQMVSFYGDVQARFSGRAIAPRA